MLGFVLRRVVAAVLLVFLVLTATFFLIHLAPGDPTLLVLADGRVPPSYRARLIELYGLDRPLFEQYLFWLRAVVVEGDWGWSYANQKPASTTLAEALPNTAILVLGTVVVQYGLGILLGVVAATRRGWMDRQIRGISLVLWAIPTFWLALILIELLSVRWGWLPVGEMRSIDARFLPPGARLLDLLHHLTLPALVLGLTNCGIVIRLVRNSLLEISAQDYVRAARARGLSRTRVLFGHALPNAVGPVIQHAGVSLPGLLGGSLIIEFIFSWPGIGQVTFSAIGTRDYPVLLAGTALSAILVVVGSLAADLLHGWIDPRVREADALAV